RVDEAIAMFRTIDEEGLPGHEQVAPIVKAYDQDKLVGANLAGLEVWKTYVEERAKIQHHVDDTTLGLDLEFFFGDWDGTKTHAQVYARTDLDLRVIARVKDHLIKRYALTWKEAMEHLSSDPNVPLDERSRMYRLLSGEIEQG